jgi:hypothetical protein
MVVFSVSLLLAGFESSFLVLALAVFLAVTAAVALTGMVIVTDSPAFSAPIWQVTLGGEPATVQMPFVVVGVPSSASAALIVSTPLTFVACRELWLTTVIV